MIQFGNSPNTCTYTFCQHLLCESRPEWTWFTLYFLLVQFEQHTKSPVASNSPAVKQVTHFKWNLCLHLLHLPQGVSSVSKYTNKWFAMSLNWNSNKIPAFALIRQIAQVHLYLQPGKSWARSSKSGKCKFIYKTDTHTHLYTWFSLAIDLLQLLDLLSQ